MHVGLGQVEVAPRAVGDQLASAATLRCSSDGCSSAGRSGSSWPCALAASRSANEVQGLGVADDLQPTRAGPALSGGVVEPDAPRRPWPRPRPPPAAPGVEPCHGLGDQPVDPHHPARVGHRRELRRRRSWRPPARGRWVIRAIRRARHGRHLERLHRRGGPTGAGSLRSNPSESCWSADTGVRCPSAAAKAGTDVGGRDHRRALPADPSAPRRAARPHGLLDAYSAQCSRPSASSTTTCRSAHTDRVADLAPAPPPAPAPRSHAIRSSTNSSSRGSTWIAWRSRRVSINMMRPR